MDGLKKPGFELPSDTRGLKDHGNNLLWFILGCVVVLGFGNGVLSIFFQPSGSQADLASDDGGPALAERLEKLNLPSEAADQWAAWLALSPSISSEMRARHHYHAGKLYQKAQKWSKALKHYIASEVAAPVAELEKDLLRARGECFQMLDNYSGRIRDRQLRNLSPSGDSKADTSQELVAEIGSWKLRKPELISLFEDDLDRSLQSVKMSLSPDQWAKIKQERLSSISQADYLQFLQQYVSKELLYRKGIDDGLNLEKSFHERMMEIRRELLAQSVVERELVSLSKTTEADLLDYFQAHKSEFKSPEQFNLQLLAFNEESKAQQALSALAAGKGFSFVRKNLGVPEPVGDDQGKLSEPWSVGGNLPLINGRPPFRFDEHVIALQAGEQSKTPVKAGDYWWIVRIVSRQPERIPPFSEVAQKVQEERFKIRQQELMQSLLGKLRDEYAAFVYTDSFSTSPSPPQQDPASPQDPATGALP